MKKLVIIGLLAALYAFGAACTATSIEEDENEIQVIDKGDVRTQDERGPDDPDF